MRRVKRLKEAIARLERESGATEGELAPPTRVVIDAANRTLTVDGIDMTNVVDEVSTSTTYPFVSAVTLHLSCCDVVMIPAENS